MNNSVRNTPIVGRAGFTLTEILIAMTIICIMVTMSVPIFSRAIEQVRLDTAARELKAIWSAQRVYWLAERSYAPNLATLHNRDLLNSSLVLTQGSLTAFYIYEIEEADESSFTAVAARNNSNKWSGEILIDAYGDITGNISATDGTTLNPVFAK